MQPFRRWTASRGGYHRAWGEEHVKTFYSAEDIEDLVAQGRRELSLDEDTVLTQLARDAANRLGLRLVQRLTVAPASPQAGARTAATVLANKPKGCQHGLLTNHSSAPTRPAANSEGVIGELVDLVKQLSNKDAQG